MNLLKDKKRLLLLTLAVFLVVVLAVPLFITADTYLSMFIETGFMILVCFGFAALYRTGQLSLGQAAFAAVGGYTSAIIAIKLNCPFVLSLLAGGIVSALVAFVLGVVVLRLGGMYFTVATLALGEIMSIVLQDWTAVTGGNIGIGVAMPAIEIGGMSLDFGATRAAYYYTIVALIILAALILWRLFRSRLGRIMTSIAVNPMLSEHSGIPLMKYKLIVFLIASFFTGIAGSFYVYYMNWAGPPLFSSILSSAALMICVIGGLWSLLAGPVIGSLIYIYLGTFLGLQLQGLRPLVFGGFVIILLLALPNGLVDLQYKFPVWVKGLFARKDPAKASN
jgi:branched-chain amino acid transport system permease protein